ncbi:MAG: I78 family peptidase inhibitor [Sphingobium sp.]
MPLLVPLAACQGADGGGPATLPPVAREGVCDNGSLASFVGQTATADLGAAMLKASGARALRWAGPGMAVTMDFRQDRLTVAYDEKMIVIRASCG